MANSLLALLLVVGNLNVIAGQGCNFPCPTLQQTVCGSDNKQYDNLCELSKATCQNNTITLKNIGECQRVCPTICSLRDNPVCGSDGQTYSSECWLQVAACKAKTDITVASKGACNSKPTQTNNCLTVCADIYNPVCGSNGVSYSNKCVLELNACRTGTNITLLSRGVCTTPISADCPAACSSVNNPVCGSDGKTYVNECQLKLSSCQAKQNVTVKSRGKCPPPTDCPSACSGVYNPVCGSDGQSYSNECILKLTACQKGQQITVKSKGICGGQCQRYCATTFQPVCGSDGQTYRNNCFLDAAICTSKGSILKVKEGFC